VTHYVHFDDAILERGFWLYVREVTMPDDRAVHYVGKTGDRPSGVSQSPFDRLSKHIGSNTNNNPLRRYFKNSGVYPEQCRFRFCAVGPLFYSPVTQAHGERCDITSSLEKALAAAVQSAGYPMMNEARYRAALDEKLFANVLTEFTVDFPALAHGLGVSAQWPPPNTGSGS
jgi:hypothetical protein